MNKIKKRIYFDLSQYAIRFYYWCEDRYWDAVRDKKRNTERIISGQDFLDYLHKTREQDDAMMDHLWRTVIFPKAKSNDE